MSHDVTTSNGKLQSSSTTIPASASTSPLTHTQARLRADDARRRRRPCGSAARSRRSRCRTLVVTGRPIDERERDVAAGSSSPGVVPNALAARATASRLRASGDFDSSGATPIPTRTTSRREPDRDRGELLARDRLFADQPDRRATDGRPQVPARRRAGARARRDRACRPRTRRASARSGARKPSRPARPLRAWRHYRAPRPVVR